MEIKAVVQCPYCAVSEKYSIGYEEFGSKVTPCQSCEMHFAMEWELTSKEKLNEIIYTVKARAGAISWEKKRGEE